MTRCVNLGRAATNHAFKAGLVSLENRDVTNIANNAYAANTNHLSKAITLEDCYSVTTFANNYTVYRHINRNFGNFNITVSYSNEAEPRITTTAQELTAAYTDAKVKSISDAVVSFGSPTAAILTASNFEEYTPLQDWVMDSEKMISYNDSQSVPLILPAGAANTLGYAAAHLEYQPALEDNADGTRNIRLLTAVKTLDAELVGFNVQITRTPLNSSDPAETSAIVPLTTTSVYSSVYANGVLKTAEDIWGEDYAGYYIVVIEIQDVAYQDYDHMFSVSRTVTLKDGTVLSTSVKEFAPIFNA